MQYCLLSNNAFWGSNSFRIILNLNWNSCHKNSNKMKTNKLNWLKMSKIFLEFNCHLMQHNLLLEVFSLLILFISNFQWNKDLFVFVQTSVLGDAKNKCRYKFWLMRSRCWQRLVFANLGQADSWEYTPWWVGRQQHKLKSIMTPHLSDN